MNTGIGDAYNLGWKLALVARGLAGVSLLDSYEAERMPFARSILNGTDRAFLLQATTDTAAQRLKIFFTPLLFRTASMLPPVRKRAFWFVSQLWTSYRDSPAVARSGPAGEGAQAGERAPYGFLATGGDAGRSIFEEIRGLDHDLLLFEGGRSETALPDPARTREDLQALVGAYGAPIRLHAVAPGNRSLHERYGANSPTLFLVRPDGHIAYRGPAEDIDGLGAYLDRYFVGPGRREGAGRPGKGAVRVG